MCSGVQSHVLQRRINEGSGWHARGASKLEKERKTERKTEKEKRGVRDSPWRCTVVQSSTGVKDRSSVWVQLGFSRIRYDDTVIFSSARRSASPTYFVISSIWQREKEKRERERVRVKSNS